MPYALANTLILVLSSVTCQFGVFAAERLQKRATGWKPTQWGMVEWMFLTYGLGSVFVIGQIYEYAQLVSEHVSLSSDAYGSAFYITTGFHALHVTGGLIAFLLAHQSRVQREELHPQRGDKRHRRLLLLALRRRCLDRALPGHLHSQIGTGIPLA